MPATGSDRLYGLTTSVAVKPPVYISADYNVTLFGEQTITSSTPTGDRTVATTEGMRILLMGQTNAVENGIWVAKSQFWVRAPDFNGPRDAVNGTLVFSITGDCWQVEATDPVVVGTSSINFRATYPFEANLDIFQRTLRVPDASVGLLPDASSRAWKQLGFDGNGNPVVQDPAGTGLWGYVPVGSFEHGAIVRQRFEIVFWEEYQEYWRWDGALPKHVSAGSTPSTAGGLGKGKWIDVTDATLRANLGSSEEGMGAALVGYNIKNDYALSTIGRKLNLMLSPYDFGAVADGTLHPLSEFFATLAQAQALYSFVTSLDQSIDWAASQKCANEVVTRGASGMTMGWRGQYVFNETMELNKTGSDVYDNKSADFTGATILFPDGQLIINHEAEADWENWTVADGAAVSGDELAFAGTTSAQAKASIVLTGLVVDRLYAVSIYIEEYTSTGYIGVFIDTTRIVNTGRSGPGVAAGEFVATATSQTLTIQDDTYSSTPALFNIIRVDVRWATYALRFYQTGMDSEHGRLIVMNPRVRNTSDDAFGGIRFDTMNHMIIFGAAVDGGEGPAIHSANLAGWSENNDFGYIKCADGREIFRASRPNRGSGTSSLARTKIAKMFGSGVRYFFVCDTACAFYDSEIGEVGGNLTSSFRAIASLHGDQTDSVIRSIRVENNSAPDTAGIFEYGKNDNRRIALQNVGAHTSLSLLADGSFDADHISRENIMTSHDFRPSIPLFNTMLLMEKSGQLGTGLTYTGGAYIWYEILLDCTPGTAYEIGTSRNLSVLHGTVQIDGAIRTAAGSTYQGTKFCVKLLKGTVATVDANKVTEGAASHTINSESVAFTWGGNGNPAITLTASENRSIGVYIRWVQ